MVVGCQEGALFDTGRQLRLFSAKGFRPYTTCLREYMVRDIDHRKAGRTQHTVHYRHDSSPRLLPL